MSVLQRKAQAGKQEHQARSMTVPKSLRVSFAKVGNDLLDLALAVIGATQEQCTGDELADKLDDNALLILLDGPGGAMGGAMLGPELVGAFVQQQTTGRVAQTPSAKRRLTATDAALCAPVIDAVFKRSSALLESQSDKDLLAVYKFGARCENARLFNLALGGPDYHVIRLTIDVAAGAFQSTLTLILPEPVEQPMLELETTEGKPAPTKNRMQSVVMDLPTEIAAILCKLEVPVAQISKLQIGQTFAVRPEAFDEVTLVGLDGRKISKGALGQVDGQRALMLATFGSGQSSGARVGIDAYDDLDRTADLGRAAVPEISEALPDLQMLDGEATEIGGPPITDIDALPDLPDLDGDLPDLSDLPDLPDFDSELPELPDLDGDLPDLDDLPKLNIA